MLPLLDWWYLKMYTQTQNNFSICLSSKGLAIIDMYHSWLLKWQPSWIFLHYKRDLIKSTYETYHTPQGVGIIIYSGRFSADLIVIYIAGTKISDFLAAILDFYILTEIWVFLCVPLYSLTPKTYIKTPRSGQLDHLELSY